MCNTITKLQINKISHNEEEEDLDNYMDCTHKPYYLYFSISEISLDVCTISLECVLSMSVCPLCKVMKKSVFQSVSQSITLVGRGVNTGNIVINEYMNTNTYQDSREGGGEVTEVRISAHNIVIVWKWCRQDHRQTQLRPNMSYYKN